MELRGIRCFLDLISRIPLHFMRVTRLVARLKPMNRDKDVSLRIGIAKGEFAVPEILMVETKSLAGFLKAMLTKIFLREHW